MRAAIRWAVCLAAITMVSLAWCAENNKVAVVDMERLVKSHPKTRSNRAILESQVDEYKAEKKQLTESFDKLQDEFKELQNRMDNKALSDEAQKELRASAQVKYTALRDFEAKAREKTLARQKEIADLETRMQKDTVAKLRELIRKVAAKKGLALVLDASAVAISGVETVMYQADGLDITDEILAMVDKESAAPGGR